MTEVNSGFRGSTPEITLLVSLGAQKSGTNWLWNYIKNHPQCATPPLKELHFFSKKGHRLQRMILEADKELSTIKNSERQAFLEDKKRFLFQALEYQQDGKRNARNFARLLLSVATEQTRLVGEFTPANGQLREGRLRALVRLVNPTKFVLILRDPVDRVWSQIRMEAANETDNPDQASERAHLILEQFIRCRTDPIAVRFDYAGTLGRVRDAVPEERLFVDYFETFFDQTHIDRFCGFAGIKPMPGDVTRKRHIGHSIELTLDHRVRLRNVLMDQYQAVDRYLGNLPKRWIETCNL